jgi:tRNA dimethylallyltransferase
LTSADSARGWRVVSVVGPTASGKSDVADILAARLGSEVVSTDAMQVYRGMDIGTAKTPPAERRAPLRCIDLAEVDQVFSVALYAEEAHTVIDGLVGEGRVPVLCGGTGLYVRAALENMEFPPGEQVANPVRERYEALAAELGPQAFHRLLAERDPQSAALVHPNNVRRVVRAFELLEQGTSYAAEHETLHVRQDRHSTLHVGLTLPRELLYERINARVDRMFEAGLLDEVAGLCERGLRKGSTARQAIGYKELIDVLDGTASLDEAVAAVKQASRRYAKRQLTWFKADGRIRWLEAADRSAESLADEIAGMLYSNT